MRQPASGARWRFASWTRTGWLIAGASVEVQTAGGRLALVTDERRIGHRPALSSRCASRCARRASNRRCGRSKSSPAAAIEIRLSLAVVRSTVEVVVRSTGLETGAGSTLAVDRTAARTVFDAIDALVPGLSVTRRGVMGYGIATNGTGGVSIRGIGGQPNTGVLVVVDGRPDVQSLMGHPLPDAYSLADAQDVRVTEGPASVLYGSNAMGGVIDIGTEPPAAGTHGQFSSSIGSYLTGQHRAAFGWAGDRHYVRMTAGVDHTDGDRPSSAYRGETVTLGAGSTLSRTWKMSLQGRFTDFRVEDPGPVSAPLSTASATVDRGGFSARFRQRDIANLGLRRAYGGFGHHVITDGFRSVGPDAGSQDPAVRGRRAADAAGRRRGRRALRRPGEERQDATRLRGALTAPTPRSSSGRSRLFSPSLEVHGGLRYDHNSFSGDIVVPELAGGVEAGRSDDRVGLGRTRLPEPDHPRDCSSSRRRTRPSSPSSVWNSQATVEVRALATVSASATVYYADVDNLIVTLGRYPNLVLQQRGAGSEPRR